MIPDSVTSIGNCAFMGCDAMTCITVSPDNPAYCDADGVLYDKDKTTLICCPGGKAGAFAVPDGVISIEDCAFEGCMALTGVTIPDSVTGIGHSAFARCDALTGVTIPRSVTSIAPFAFYGCRSLVSVTIPDSVTSIGNFACIYCSSLQDVTMPKGIRIGKDAFKGTPYGEEHDLT
jgi:hypothetical protein